MRKMARHRGRRFRRPTLCGPERRRRHADRLGLDRRRDPKRPARSCSRTGHLGQSTCRSSGSCRCTARRSSTFSNESRHTIIVENNYSGQFARYLRSETSFVPHGHIRKYDGEPFMPHHIVEAVKEQLSRQDQTVRSRRTKLWFEEMSNIWRQIHSERCPSNRDRGRFKGQGRSRLVSRAAAILACWPRSRRPWSSCRSRTTTWSPSAASAARPTSRATSIPTACTPCMAARWRWPPA